jgi:hypothetical protein
MSIDDSTLQQLQEHLAHAKIHFYLALKSARNVHHADNREALSSRLERIHEELNQVSDFAEARKATA